MTQPDPLSEQAIAAAGANVAPRVTPADIEASIASEHYFSAWDGVSGAFERGNLHQRHPEHDTLTQPPPARTPFESMQHITICALVLRNGTTVLGVNHGPVSPENFNAELGRADARQKAVAQIWPLLGYELRTRIWQGHTTIADRTNLSQPVSSQ